MTNSTTMVQLLGSIRKHLTAFDLPAQIASVKVGCDALDGELATVHLRPSQVVALASALLSWADTLTMITVTAWRPPHGETVHLTLTGRLPDATSVAVFGGIDYTDALFGDLQPDGQVGVALSVLRVWVAGSSAVAA